MSGGEATVRMRVTRGVEESKIIAACESLICLSPKPLARQGPCCYTTHIAVSLLLKQVNYFAYSKLDYHATAH
jgi:hypothetical protein